MFYPAQLTNLDELGYLTADAGAGRRASGDPCRKRCSRAGENRQRQNGGFGLGLLQQIDASLFQTQALVLCPTRELAIAAGELCRLAFSPNTKILTLCGGQPFGMQRDSLQTCAAYYRGNAGPFVGSSAKRHGITGCVEYAGDG